MLRSNSVTDVIPEGGRQNPLEYPYSKELQVLTRESARCMYPDEFIRILQKHKHPRWASIGVLRTIYGDNPRAEVGLRSHGTIFVANAKKRRWLLTVPSDCIPYSTVRTAIWDEFRSKWVNGDLARGWRSLLRGLIEASYLSPHPDLSFLIGEDTFKLSPKPFRR